MVLLRCQCCGFEREFEDGDHAFREGWDAPPHFTGYVCCNLCPATCSIMRRGHTLAHVHWEDHGRPECFGPDCLPDDKWGKDQAAFDADMEQAKSFASGVISEILKRLK